MKKFGMIEAAALAGCALIAASGAAGARDRGTRQHDGSVPYLDVKSSCIDAQKFSATDDKNTAYKGCMQDETNAKDELVKRWSSFKPKDRTNCVEQARFPSPSYVEVLTCLEMTGDAMRNAPRVNGQPVPQIGGPMAPGLTGNPVPPSQSPSTTQ
jgi:hypothetical protein